MPAPDYLDSQPGLFTLFHAKALKRQVPFRKPDPPQNGLGDAGMAHGLQNFSVLRLCGLLNDPLLKTKFGSLVNKNPDRFIFNRF
jgi:hypothetical protein